MRNKIIFKRVIIISLVLSFLGWTQENELLDLTVQKNKAKLRANDARTHSGGGIGGGLSHGNRRSILPIRLILSNLDKEQFTLGERFIYEITLQNLGDQTLLIPWESEIETLKPDPDTEPAGLMEGSFYLIIDEIQGGVILGAQRIYGSHVVPRSLKRLLPGQKVRFRAEGVWYFLSEDVRRNVMAALPQAFNIKAKFMLRDSLITSETLPSNILQVILEK